jgi:MFS family permease
MKPKLMMAWLLSYISIASVSASIITPALPNLEHDFALATSAVEWVVSSFLIGYVAGQLLYGPLANVYGRIKALKWGLNINLLGLMLCVLAGFYHQYDLLLLGRLITGLGSAAGLTCTFMLINEWLPENERKTAMSYSILSFALGIGFSVVLGGVITQHFAWQGCFGFLIFQGIAMRLGVGAFDETLKEPKPLHLRTLIMDYWQALRSLKLLVFSLVWGTCSAMGYCYSASAPQVAHQYFHLDVAEYGYWNVLNILGMLIGGLSARFFMNQFSVVRVIALGYIGSTLAWIFLFVLFQTQTNSPLCFFLSTALLYCASAYLFAGGSFVASNAIDDKASASSMMSFINMSTATLSVVLLGYLSLNPFVGFLCILGIVFALSFLLWLLFQVAQIKPGFKAA